MPRRARIYIGSFTLLACVVSDSIARADVIVLANRAGAQVPFRFVAESGETQQVTIQPNETMPLYLDGRGDVIFTSKGAAKHYTLDANCAYYFGRNAAGQVDLQKIGLGEDQMAAAGRKLPGSASQAPTIMIPVKILVDEEEPARQIYWERRLRARVEAASRILERYCRVGFRVESVGTWNSDNSVTEFFDALGEFERKVDPTPARIAIGFTSQWPMARGRIHMAGTRGPLHSHILVREGSPEINEAERLEFLVHELCHFLGAAHSPEPQSVMRPVLGDNRATAKATRIQVDPVNALTMCMIAEEMRRSNLKKVSELQSVTRQRLEKIYMELGRSLPNDPAGMQYAVLMRTAQTPLAAAAKKIVQQIASAAIDNRALPIGVSTGPNQPARRTGDLLTEYYVREAARAASKLPADAGQQAFFLGTAIGLDSSNTLAGVSGIAPLLEAVEPKSERMARVAMLGTPTMRGRSDFMQHFFVSAFLSSAIGAEATDSKLLDAELQTAQLPNGLSFRLIAAERAGSRFAKILMEKRISLNVLASTFTVDSFLPKVDSFPEGISAKDLAAQYGPKTDPRFAKQLRDIDQQILLSPGYRMASSVFGK